jgi:hypothetical protein
MHDDEFEEYRHDRPSHSDDRMQDDSYRHDRYPPSHSDDRMQDDSFYDDPMTKEDATRKPSSKVDLPEPGSVGLAKVKFPRRGDLSLPSPAVDALQLNSRNEIVGARAGMPLPEDEMDAHLTTRDDNALVSALGAVPMDARSYPSGPQGSVSRIMRSNSDGLALPETPSMDLAKVGTAKREGLGLGDTGKNAVQEVL